MTLMGAASFAPAASPPFFLRIRVDTCGRFSVQAACFSPIVADVCPAICFGVRQSSQFAVCPPNQEASSMRCRQYPCICRRCLRTAGRCLRGFVGDAAALGATIAHLRARREGHADAAEPTGLMTHHLVDGDTTWAFVDDLLGRTTAHPAATWLTAAAVFDAP